MSDVKIYYPETDVAIAEPVLKIKLSSSPFGGSGGASASAFFEAGQPLSAGRAVVSQAGKAFLFDPLDASHYRGLIGFTKTSAVQGALVEVVHAGFFEDIGLSLVADKLVFAGLNGVLTTVPPVAGIYMPVGVAITPTKFLINFTSPIIVV